MNITDALGHLEYTVACEPEDFEAVCAVRLEINKQAEAKNQAYRERNQLVKFLSKCYPSSIEQHDGADWEDDWRNVVFIDLPTGQVSWHIHDSELPNFEHLPHNHGRKWDGHSTELKYQRLDDLWVHALYAQDYQTTKRAQAGKPEAGYTIRNRESATE